MKYMLLIYSNPSEVPPYSPELNQEWQNFAAESQAAGVFVANHGLRPVSDATTVRVRNGKTMTTDGPFAETHEQLGGYFIFECKDLDEAIQWASKIPGARFGSIEIRPVWS
jgi:hypothetical protein